jgi:hypothetical protein
MTAHGVFRFESGPDIMRIESCFLFQQAHEEFGVANRYSLRSEHGVTSDAKSAEKECGGSVRRKSAHKVGVKVIYYVRRHTMSASAQALHRMGGAKGAGRVKNGSIVNG